MLDTEKVPCPVCHGNGYVRDEEGTAGCNTCDCQGEITAEQKDCFEDLIL